DGRGRANAFKTGLKHIGSEYDYVVMLSTDGNERPGDIRKIVEKLDEDYDMVIATRFGKGKSKDVTVLRNFGNYFFTVLCNLFTGYKLTDAQNGFRGIRRKAFLDMNIQANRFDIEDEMVMKAGKMKLKVTEIPTIEDEREFGKSRLNTFKDGWLIFKRIINVAFSKPPYR
ncbi:MAG: glycosyltransferase family 2 protein, partial [Nanoarchaeota archaeon]|nr:glycosyltransferase family 2 protein [Nanoarchaeota archaeon]